MRWSVVLLALAVALEGEALGPRRCAGRLARERIKAAEKTRDKRFYSFCCTALCTQPRRPRPPPSTSRYQPFHRTWFGLKYGCNCSILGAEGNACDIKTGQCRCKPNVTGRACDTCDVGYWGLTAAGCHRCRCGAGAAACDPVSGACACARGVTGAHCDTCLAGYYGFGPAGCLPCPSCPAGRTCSPASGRCVCPARTRGARCEICAPGHWGDAPHCTPCRCGHGASSGQCDAATGQCPCRTGFTGPLCAECAPGYYGPRCRPCGCSASGTRLCGEQPCPCDQHGNCLCKDNVTGPKCTQCRPGTFGLSAESASGCTACFCFGRAAHCTQAGLARAALHAAGPRHLTLLPGQIPPVDEDSLLAIHTDAADATIALPHPPVPVYLELDKRFLGDRVTSYGGWLKFKVEEEGGEELPSEVRNKFPLVRIYGEQNIVLDYYERVPPVNGSHQVRLEESLWRVRSAGAAAGAAPAAWEAVASRAALMALLQSVQRVLLRVTTRAPLRDNHVHALLLNVSLDTTIPGDGHTAPALGVELCDCAASYRASSCQRPAVGFWLPAPRVRYSTAAGTIVIHLEGEAKPCRCNGRATQCDAATGDCLNCTGGTGGPRCEECAAGHVGHPDSAAGCQPCPCPERTRNYAAACAFVGDRLTCLCKPGYTGSTCSECTPGYYRGGTGDCLPCACDPRGAAAARCDTRGRCRCRPFAAGDRCDQCAAPRTYLTNQGCAACDNCTQTLLDSVEQLTAEFQLQADLVDLSRIPQPYPALREYQHNATVLQARLHHLREHTDRRDFDRELQALYTDAERLLSSAQKQKYQAQLSDKAANYLAVESATGLSEVSSQRARITAQVSALDEFARGERHLSAHRALKDARHLRATIQDVNLQDYGAGVSDVFDAANIQSTSIRERNYAVSSSEMRLKQLQAALAQWRTKADDLSRLADSVWDAADAVAAVRQRTRPRLQAARELALRCVMLLEDVTNLNATNLTEATSAAISRARQLTQGFPALSSELLTLSHAAEEKEGILYNLTPGYREKYLAAAGLHATELGKKAKEYKELFSGSLSLAAAGVGAARAWRRVDDTMRAAAAAADDARHHALLAAGLATGARPLAVAADAARNNSLRHRDVAKAALDRANELSSSLEELQRGAVRVSVALRALGWQERALNARPQASREAAHALEAAGARAERVWGRARALHDEAAELRRRARYQLRRALGELARHGDSALGAAQEHVSQILGNTLRAKEVGDALTDAASARAREHDAADNKLRPTTDRLRDMIAKARHAADSITVSLTSKPGTVGCARAYLSRSPSPAATRISLALSFDGAVRSGPLLHLEGERDSYMRLVVEGARAQLVWDLGDGERRLEHTELLQATHDDADHTSYKIDIERVWSTVRLTVTRAGASSITVTSNGTASARGLLMARRLWLGAPTGRFSEATGGLSEPAGRLSEATGGLSEATGGLSEATGELSEPTVGLPGCVHELRIDERRIGLWDFVHQPAEARCEGCTQRWWASPGASGLSPRAQHPLWSFHAGYAALRRSSFRPPDPRHFSVAFAFRTRDRDALLFVARDDANNRSVSVMLRSCRVVFLVQYTAATLEISAAGTHCHGRTVHVQAIRLFANNRLEKGSLRVNGEETLGSPTPPVQTASSLPDLSRAVYWLGGVPPGVQSAGLPPLLGCLGALTVDREGYDLLDTSARKGVEAGCGARTLRTSTLEGFGYIELPSPAFRRKAALGLSFRARHPSGLLLHRAPASEGDEDEGDADDKHYLTVELIDGSVQVVASAGQGELRLRSNGTRYDDSRLHALRLHRLHKQLELWIDDQRIATGALSGNALRARGGGLYVGGATQGDGAPRQGFTGTVADLIFDGVLIGFDSAVNWTGAALGRADNEPEQEPRTEPRALQAQPQTTAECTKTASYTVEPGAVKFGDASGSHATIRLAPRDLKDLAFALQFRTFRPDGLLALIPGSKSKPRHHLALSVREGKLRLSVRGRRRRDLSLPEHVADGTWRSVSVRLSNQRAVLAAGGAAAAGRARRVTLAARVHVGGLPAPLPQLPRALLAIGGFLGCARRVWIGARAHDLARARAFRVGQCFPSVEPGAHFAGDAHAVWSRSWSLEGGTEAAGELRLRFRASEPNGVLVAARGLQLQLAAGAVVVTRDSGGARQSVSARGAGERALCDGAWHAVVARVSSAAVTLSVDAGPEIRSDGTGLGDGTDAAPVLSPLYIGGVPEGASDVISGGKENFKGCIRDVSIGGDKRDWSNMDSLHNVLLDSCPLP